VRVRSKGANSVLAIDIGGTHIKVLTTGQPEEREIPSGSNMTARKMARDVKGDHRGLGICRRLDRLSRTGDPRAPSQRAAQPWRRLGWI